MKKLLLFFTIVTISLCAMAQKSINDYKYILVPKKFDFQKSEDKYQLNSITKFLFNKYGYEAYFTDEELPEDLNNNPCLALTTEANDEKGNLFKTKVEIILKDCFGEVVKKSKVGESRIKRYERAYNEALREAFKTFQDLDYKYVQEIKEDGGSKELETNVSKDAIILESGTVKNKKRDKIELKRPQKKSLETKEIYYAQAIDNGFQIVDASPKIVMVLFYTAAKDVFIVKDKNAIVFKKDGEWLYSENDGTDKSSKIMNIKF